MPSQDLLKTRDAAGWGTASNLSNDGRTSSGWNGKGINSA